MENELEWAATNNLTLSTSFTFLDSRLTSNYCGAQGVTNCPDQVTPEAFGPNFIGPQAPAGTNLPITSKFKGNIVARYSFDEVAGWKPFGQAAFVYQTQTAPTLRVDETQIMGMQPAYGLLDLGVGASINQSMVQFVVTNATNRLAQLSRFAQTVPAVDNQTYIIPAQPRTFAIKFGQKF